MTTDDQHAGTSSLLVTNRVQNWQGPTLDVTKGLAVGRAVGVSVWVKLAPGQGSTSLDVTIQRDKAGTATGYDGVPGASGVVTDAVWTQLKGTYTLGAPVGKAQIYVEGTAGASFMIDDFRLSEIVETPPIQRDIPAWFCKDGTRDLTNSPADQALLKARMEAHIKAIADHIDKRYPDGNRPIWAWDVVDEVIADGDTANPHDMRDSRWFQVLGEGFVDEAFRLADRYVPNQKLFINDYNTEMPSTGLPAR